MIPLHHARQALWEMIWYVNSYGAVETCDHSRVTRPGVDKLSWNTQLIRHFQFHWQATIMGPVSNHLKLALEIVPNRPYRVTALSKAVYSSCPSISLPTTPSSHRRLTSQPESTIPTSIQTAVSVWTFSETNGARH